MDAFIIRSAQRPNLQMPWPVRVTEDGAVTAGRPDAATLVGFQRDPNVMRLDVSFRDAITDFGTPRPIGLFPVYAAADGSGLFVVTDAITAFDTVEA